MLLLWLVLLVYTNWLGKSFQQKQSLEQRAISNPEDHGKMLVHIKEPWVLGDYSFNVFIYLVCTSTEAGTYSLICLIHSWLPGLAKLPLQYWIFWVFHSLWILAAVPWWCTSKGWSWFSSVSVLRELHSPDVVRQQGLNAGVLLETSTHCLCLWSEGARYNPSEAAYTTSDVDDFPKTEGAGCGLAYLDKGGCH